MKEIDVSKFKTNCVALLKEVNKTGEPIRVMRAGQAIVEIVPPENAKRTPRLGSGIGAGTIRGDIVGPTDDSS